MTDTLLYWGLGLLAISLILVIFEVFLPTAGVVGVVSLVLAIVGVVCLFRYDFRWGLAGSLTILVLGPAVFFMALQVFPSTPFGRKIINAAPTEDGPPPELSALARMIDAEGEALTDLRPGGFVHIPSAGPPGKRVAAMSDVAFVPAGTPIRVTAADGMQVRVRPVG